MTGGVLGWLDALAAELQITIADWSVWFAIAEGLLFGAICLLFGVWVARLVGLQSSDAPAGETLGVGLASGLLVLASWWAAVASGGRSSFTPVAVGFAIAIGLAAVRRRHHVSGAEPSANASVLAEPPTEPGPRHAFVVAVVGAALFAIATALLYGSTLTLSPRDGVQPLEFYDEAYYAVLGANLSKTGIETSYSTSGFGQIAGLPTQTWYHWGEMWLASAVSTIFGATPLSARHFMVLPILLLASAAMTGTLVRRMTTTSSRGAYLFGFLACLFLAPLPLARGLVFGITTYGLAAVAVLLALYCIIVLGHRNPTWALACFVGSAAALILPAHVVIAFLAVVGLGSALIVTIIRSPGPIQHIRLITIERRTSITTGLAVAVTLVWGLVTGHGIASSLLTPSVAPFNSFWQDAVVMTAIGAGAFLAIAVAWFMARAEDSLETRLYFGTAAILVVGTVVWGARLGDFYTLHLFFGAIAVFATPASAVAVWSVCLRLRASGHTRPAIAVLVLCGSQMVLGVPLGVTRLQIFGPGTYPPIPLAMLAEIRSLPQDARLAYACQPFEESAFWSARLLGLEAHTGRGVVPMCFEADTLGVLTGGQLSAGIPSPVFQRSPQSALYPSSDAAPSAATVAKFLKGNGIDYIYADALHPNTMIPDARPIATSGMSQVLQIP